MISTSVTQVKHLFILSCATILLSCSHSQKIINPKVSKIRFDGENYRVYVWYYDSWLMATFKNLPDSIKKGKRITIYPSGGDFKRVGKQTRPW